MFYLDNISISFIVTNDPDCIVSLRQVDSIQLNTRIQTTVAEFMKADGPTAFVNSLAAVLGLDTSQIKIVGIREGSVVLNYYIQSQVVKDDPSVDPNTVSVTNQSAVAEILLVPTPIQSQIQAASASPAETAELIKAIRKDIVVALNDPKVASQISGGY